MDFEVAISNAIKAVWPNLRIRGCTFHLSQTIIRQLGKIYTLVNGRNKSLKVLYGLSVDFKLDVKKMFCLCFVPPLSIAEYFDDLCGSMTDEAKLLADWRLQLLGSDGNTVWFSEMGCRKKGCFRQCDNATIRQVVNVFFDSTLSKTLSKTCRKQKSFSLTACGRYSWLY